MEGEGGGYPFACWGAGAAAAIIAGAAYRTVPRRMYPRRRSPPLLQTHLVHLQRCRCLQARLRAHLVRRRSPPPCLHLAHRSPPPRFHLVRRRSLPLLRLHLQPRLLRKPS